MTAWHRRGLWLTAVAPPLGWIAQGLGGWYIVAHACPAGEEPLALGRARLLVGVITAVALVVSGAALWAAQRAWRRAEPFDDDSAVSERRIFTAMAGTLVAVTVTLGLVLAVLPMLLLRACGETR
jgi:hypothetical protein